MQPLSGRSGTSCGRCTSGNHLGAGHLLECGPGSASRREGRAAVSAAKDQGLGETECHPPVAGNTAPMRGLVSRGAGKRNPRQVQWLEVRRGVGRRGRSSSAVRSDHRSAWPASCRTRFWRAFLSRRVRSRCACGSNGRWCRCVWCSSPTAVQPCSGLGASRYVVAVGVLTCDVTCRRISRRIKALNGPISFQ